MRRDEQKLEWLAFCYVADELSPAERAAFEKRLVDDQAAREAVALAVELSLATELVFSEDATIVAAQKQLQVASPKRGWWSVALACGGLLALIVINKLAWQPGENHTQSRDLAIAWSETRAAYPTSAMVESREEATDEATETVTFVDDALLGPDGEIALPTWMIAAVSEAQSNMSETNSGDAIPE